MKKIDAILSGKKLTEVLTSLKKRQINRVFEAAKDNAEKQKEDASIAYQKLFLSMAEDDANFENILKRMLEQKQIIISAEDTLKALSEIKADLETEE